MNGLSMCDIYGGCAQCPAFGGGCDGKENEVEMIVDKGEIAKEAAKVTVSDKVAEANGRRIVVKEYVYGDAYGRTAYKKIIYDMNDGTKCIKIMRPDATDPSGWKNGLDGVELVPYQLPELLQAKRDGMGIIVCDGEDECAALTEIGYAATTVLFGTGHWRDSYTELLAGADVIIIPDNDEYGRLSAECVRCKILPAVKSICVIDLQDVYPDLPEHESVGHILRGIGTVRTRILLDEAIERAERYSLEIGEDGEVNA